MKIVYSGGIFGRKEREESSLKEYIPFCLKWLIFDIKFILIDFYENLRKWIFGKPTTKDIYKKLAEILAKECWNKTEGEEE